MVKLVSYTIISHIATYIEYNFS